MKKHLNFDNLVLVLTLLATVLLLYWRFKIGLTRFFDDDEFRHMFRAYLISTGKIPYKDFGYFYSPVWAVLLSPAFYFFKENVTSIILSRTFAFIVFLANVIMVGLIAAALGGRKKGVLAAFLLAFFPAMLDKTIEIRPDPLATFFWLLSFFFLLLSNRIVKKRNSLILLAGVSFGLALTVIIKLIFAYPGLLLFLILSRAGSFKEKLKEFRQFHFGLLIPWLFLLLIFAALKILPEAFYSIFIQPQEVFKAYKRRYFDPKIPFAPVDALYGVTGRHLTWRLNLGLFLLGAAGLLKSRNRLSLSVFFASFWIAVFYIYNVSLVQYWLPLFILSSIGGGEILGSVGDIFLKRSKYLFLTGWVLLLSILVFGFWKSAKVHLQWNNDAFFYELNKIWAVSNADDHFYDMTGLHLFRPSGYFLCCEIFPDWQQYQSWLLPDFQEEIRRAQTKFLVQNNKIGRLSEADRVFIDENFFPSGIENIFVSGRKIVFPNVGSVEFELLADGKYRVFKDGNGVILIDTTPVEEDIIYLTGGKHVVRSAGVKELFLLYDITANKN